MKIVVLDGFAMNPGDLSWDEMGKLGDLTVYERTSASELMDRASGAEVLFTNKTVISAEAISALPQLKFIGVLATGYNVVDTDAARTHGVVVTNIPAYSTNSVAQMVFAHILNIVQRVDHYAVEARARVWSHQADFSYSNTPVIELWGKKIGIVGFGNTGSATARIALGFGMDVRVFTSKSQSELPQGVAKADSIDSLFATCDIVSLHCPLTPQTREMVNARRLALMQPHAILINTGRGPLVNEVDLADALSRGTLMAAGLDVMVSEPPVETNPLLDLDNCFITPHIAWASYEARVRLMQLAVGNLKAYLDGNTINDVTK